LIVPGKRLDVVSLLESIYQKCLIEEFEQRGIQYKSELTVPVTYKGKEVDAFLRCDFLIEDCIVIELKSVSSLLPIIDLHATSKGAQRHSLQFQRRQSTPSRTENTGQQMVSDPITDTSFCVVSNTVGEALNYISLII
jgi:GxxExxY protein